MRNYILSLFSLVLLFCCSTSKEIIPEKRFVNPVVVGPEVKLGFQIFLVRHAEKDSDGTKDPNLKEEGTDRAKRLANHLRAAGITKIYSTDYKRTRQTAEPLAKLLGIEIEIYETDLINITSLLNNHENGNVLVVGHSNTTPKLMNNLLGEQRFESLDEKDYDNLFIVSCFGAQKSPTILKF